MARSLEDTRFLRTVVQGLLQEYCDELCYEAFDTTMSPPQSPQMFTESYI